MRQPFLKTRKEEMSDGERSKKRRIHKRCGSMSPVFSDSHQADDWSLTNFRRMCDLCMEPRKPGGPKLYGRARTFVNADKQVDLRYLAELALKLYNDDKLLSFKLVKVCKINRIRIVYYGLTFRAQEDGTEECPVFRGVVHAVRGKNEASFCEIKDDDEITLLSCDDDYVNSVQNKLVKVKIGPLHT